jgi:hypothetical protein
MPQSNSNPVTLPCATGNTLSNYLLKTTKYEEILNELNKVYDSSGNTKDSSGNLTSLSNTKELFKLLQIPTNDTSINSDVDIIVKLTNLKKTLESFTTELTKYKNNNYLGYVVEIKRTGNDIEVTVYRDRLALPTNNGVHIIDVNSSIFGYDMSRMNLPSTNIVYRKKINESTVVPLKEMITGYNSSEFKITAPDKTDTSEKHLIVRYQKNHGLDLCVRVNVYDRVKDTITKIYIYTIISSSIFNSIIYINSYT